MLRDSKTQLGCGQECSTWSRLLLGSWAEAGSGLRTRDPGPLGEAAPWDGGMGDPPPAKWGPGPLGSEKLNHKQLFLPPGRLPRWQPAATAEAAGGASRRSGPAAAVGRVAGPMAGTSPDPWGRVWRVSRGAGGAWESQCEAWAVLSQERMVGPRPSPRWTQLLLAALLSATLGGITGKSGSACPAVGPPSRTEMGPWAGVVVGSLGLGGRGSLSLGGGEG